MDLSVEIAGIRLKNPVIAASGTFGYGLEFAHLVDLNALGGFVVKGLSREPMAGNPAPRIVETAAGMLNAIGLQNVGVDAFIREKLPELRKYNTAVFANIFGNSTEDYVAVAERLESAEGLAGYEINVSCPNTKRGGMMFGADPALTAEVTSAVKRVARRPVIVKLSPNVTDIAIIARAAEEAGADAISLVNTFVALAIDLDERRPALPNITGGLSGPAIKPIALRMVYQAASAVKIPVIGMGGIANGRDALEFMVAGAAAVQVGTTTFWDPLAAPRIVKEMEAWCRAHGVEPMRSLTKSLQSGGPVISRWLRKIAAFAERPICLWLLFVCVGVPRFLGPILAANRSLWLDEAWVANSVISDSLADMFYYPTFLQTSPPLFLLLVRFAVHLFGLTNWSFRIVPLAMQILFTLGMLLLARKTLSGPFAALAWTVAVISPVILEYATQLKQYTTEAAASTALLLFALAYLRDPSRRRFVWLTAGAILCDFLAYPGVFLVPGIALAVALREDGVGRRWRRAGIFAAAAVAVFLIEYVLLVIPNSSPALSKSWFDGRMAIMGRPVSVLDAFERFTIFLSLPDPNRIRGKWALAGAVLILGWGASIAIERWNRGSRRLPLLQLIFLTPCLLVLAASLLRQFPLSTRVCTFLLPCVVLLFVSGLQTIAQAVMKMFARLRAPLVGAVMLVTVLTAAMSTDTLHLWDIQQSEEDMQSATAFLQSRASDRDLVLVHSSTSEAFRFYETMFHWNPAGVKWGHTGWPCCRRGSQDAFDTPSEVQLYRDLQANIPADFSGRIWFLHTTRPFHWQMVELYEPRETWRYFRSRGCRATQFREFTGVAVQVYRCP